MVLNNNAKNPHIMICKNILFTGLITLFVSANALGQRGMEIIAFVCGQTEVLDIGPGCQTNVDKVKDFLNTTGSQLGIKVEINEFIGDNYTRSNITRALDGLNLDNPDSTILVFYISGHGFNYPNPPSQFAILGVHPTKKRMKQSEFHSNGLSLELHVHPKLLATNARLVLTFGEACNTPIRDLQVPQELINLQGLRVMSGNVNKRYEELFLETQGDLLSTSSQLGEDSWMDMNEDAGGIWTNQFLAAFQQVINQDETASWADVLDAAREKTLAETVAMGTPQHALAKHRLVNTPTECEDCDTEESTKEVTRDDLIIPRVTIKSHRKKPNKELP